MLPYLHHNIGTWRFWQCRQGSSMSEGFSLALRSRQQPLQFSKHQEQYAACQPVRVLSLADCSRDSSCSHLQEPAAL